MNVQQPSSYPINTNTNSTLAPFSSVQPPPRPSQELNNLLSTTKQLVHSTADHNQQLNSSPSTSSSKSSSFSSLVNTSSNQSPYSSISTLIQQQQQQFNLFKLAKPVKMLPMSNSLEDGSTSSGMGAPNRPSLGQPAGLRPGLMGSPATSAKSSPPLKIENLRPKKQAYYFKADDNQHLIGRPNELIVSGHDDHELSSMLDEELNSSKSDESNLRDKQQQRNQQQQHRTHHHHHHHHHHHISLNNIKSRGGKITISPDQV